MESKGIKKILLLGIVLLIVAGIVVVALKGFKVSLILQKHESISLIVGKEVVLDDIKQICKDTFGGKRFIVKTVDRFSDAINIRVESITNEEKDKIANALNDKYGTTFNGASITVHSNSNVRMRDIIKPYVKPFVIAAILIVTYLIVRFRKMNAWKVLGNATALILLTEAVIASVISITRIPLSATIINIMIVVAVAELVVYIGKLEKNYKELV